MTPSLRNYPAAIALLVCSTLLSSVSSFQPAAVNKRRIKTRTAFDASTTYNYQMAFSWSLKSTTESKATTSDDEKVEASTKENTDSSSSSSSMNKYKEEKLDMPWSDTQNDALRDNLAKYTVSIPLKNDDEDESKEQQSQVFALWRTMVKDVPEIAGYPINFLQKMHARQIQNSETLLEVTPGLLPYLDDYEFAAAGGVSGKIYGVPGLADGARIETSEVTNIEVTLPQGFVRTSDGLAAYEVGRPKREEFSSSIDSPSASSAVRTGGELLKNVANTAGTMEKVNVDDADGMLVRLGATTGILLAGATAVSMLSHHLTVNVFWV